MEAWSKLISSFAELVSALAWPAVAFYLIYRFGSTLRDFITTTYEGSFKVFGVEAIAKRERQVQAVAQAELKSENPNVDTVALTVPTGAGKSRRLAELVSRAIPSRSLEGHRILWVDDKPTANLAEQRALIAYGLNIVTTTSTEQALDILQREAFDVVISDLKRGQNQIAGFELLAEIKKRNIRIPVIFYTSTHGPDLETDAISRGAIGLTNQASDLLLLVQDALSPNRDNTNAFQHWWNTSRPAARGRK